MDELSNTHFSRASRTLDVEVGEASREKSAASGLHSTVTSAAILPAGDIDSWKHKVRQELEKELAAKYEKLYSDKMKKVLEEESRYQEANHRLAQLIKAAKEAAEQNLSICLKDLNAITASLVLQSLYKILGDDKKYKTYLSKIVQDAINSFGKEIGVSGYISPYDYELLANEELFSEVKSFIRPDEKLKKGQFYIDDGSTTYEFGILDRLDVLRSAFMNAVGRSK